MSVWNYVVTAHKPTNVTHSCVGNFTSAQELNLIIAYVPFRLPFLVGIDYISSLLISYIFSLYWDCILKTILGGFWLFVLVMEVNQGFCFFQQVHSN